MGLTLVRITVTIPLTAARKSRPSMVGIRMSVNLFDRNMSMLQPDVGDCIKRTFIIVDQENVWLLL